jgi:hypothetical protein
MQALPFFVRLFRSAGVIALLIPPFFLGGTSYSREGPKSFLFLDVASVPGWLILVDDDNSEAEGAKFSVSSIWPSIFSISDNFTVFSSRLVSATANGSASS